MSQTWPEGCESDKTVRMARLASLVSLHFSHTCDFLANSHCFQCHYQHPVEKLCPPYVDGKWL